MLAVAIETGTISDDDRRPMSFRIWAPRPHAEAGRALIVISHGAGANERSYSGLADVLVRQGFVVAAMTHTGDNMRDQSDVRRGVQLEKRVGHVRRMIDYMLEEWPQRDRLAAGRIGLFGHSAGGFTALVTAGARPDLTKGGAYFRANPQSWTWRYLQKHGFTLADLDQRPPVAWQSDPRVKAIVVAAPAVGYSFDADALARVAVPVQLWEAGHDLVVDDSGETIHRALPGAHEFRRVANSGHCSFLSPDDVAMKLVIGSARLMQSLFGITSTLSDRLGSERTEFEQDFHHRVAGFFARHV